jgi:uncharacterized membrane protein YbhN (UPF0104 family)
LYFLIPAVGLFVLSKVVSAWRLKLFFDTIGIRLTGYSNLRLYWLGMYYNIFLPGGIGGDGYKAYLLKKHFSFPVKRILSAIVLDRASGLLVVLLFSVLLFSLLIDPLWLKALFWSAIPLGYLVYWLVMMRWFAVFQPIVHRINLYSLVVQLSQVVMVWMILLSWGIQGHYTAYLAAFMISSVVAILPVTIGGAGAREMAFLFLSQYLVFDLNTAIALSLMFYLITLLVSFAGIVYSLRPLKLGGSEITYLATD